VGSGGANRIAGVFTLLGRFAGGRTGKWIVLVAWIALAAAFGPLQTKLADVTVDDDAGALPEDSQSRQVTELLADRAAIVVYHRDGKLTDADRQRVLAEAKELAEVEGATGEVFTGFMEMAPPGLLSEQGDTVLTALGFPTDDPAELEGPVEEIREIVDVGEEGGLTVHVTGDAPLEVDFESEFEAGEAVLLYVTGVLVLLLLLLIYRSPVT
jgi:putative drug exporter of the RND superfamily